ncbi:MAG TPA: YqgE/AlgH family protein [Thermoanaerobaculia bacterium]|nr:YqgE/AlgH family protein [Thermoanaerobaculia bacterium]
MPPEPTASSQLETPTLLIAMPQVQDSFFRKSVVLLIHHEDEGSVGLIVNRPTGIPTREILEGMEIPWQGGEAVMTHFGGPVQPQIGTVLFAAPEVGGNGNGFAATPLPDLEAATPIAPGISLTQHIGDLGQLAAEPPERFRLLLGYAGWGEGQLIEEILRNDWLTAPVSVDLVFADDAEDAWTAALASVGVDAATLPSWTAGSGPEGAN